MKSKLHIDIVNGIIQVEGSEDFVLKLYQDFKDTLPQLSLASNVNNIIADEPINPEEPKEIPAKVPSSSQKKTKNSSRKSTTPKLSLIKELDLSGNEKQPSLKDFYSEYRLRNNDERNLLFVYYLKIKREIEGVTTDHVYTCYDELRLRIPANLHNALAVTAHRGWLDTSSLEDIQLTTKGKNYFDLDLEKAGEVDS